MASMKIVFSSGLLLSNEANLKRQLRDVKLMAENCRRSSTIYCGSSRFRCFLRFVVTAGIHVIIYAVDTNTFICASLVEDVKRKMTMKAYVDSRTAFNGVTNNRITAKNCLQFEESAIRRRYHNRELKRIWWVPERKNAVYMSKRMF